MYYVAFPTVGDKYQEITEAFMLYSKGLTQQARAAHHLPSHSKGFQDWPLSYSWEVVAL